MDPADGPTEPARGQVEGWPEDAVVIGLVAPAGSADACEAAAELADASARDRGTLLANLAGGDPDLDRRLGAATGEGLLDAGRSGRSLRQVAARPPGRDFLYLPAGRARGSDRELDDGVRARLAGLMARVAERVRERGGRLLLYIGAEASWPAPLYDLMDGLVLLAGSEPPAVGARAPEVLGRVPGAADAGPGAPSGAGPARGDVEARPDAAGAEPVRGTRGDEASPPGSWRRHRRATGVPWARIAAGVAVIAALAAGWWWLVRETAGAGSGGDGAAPARAGAETVPPPHGGPGEEAPGADASPAPGARDGAGAGARAGDEGAGRASAAGGLRDAPELRYSVLIASYAQWPQARQRLRRWRDSRGPVYFVAPTRVRGGLYWRLFAGATPDRAAGEALMEELVEAGRKDRERAWDVRPVELAFLVDTAGSRGDALDRVEALEEGGVPAYALPAAPAGDTVWAVYSGAFESDEEAAELRALLAEAEIEAELVTRRGESDIR